VAALLLVVLVKDSVEVLEEDPQVETAHPPLSLLVTLVSEPLNKVLRDSSQSVVPLKLLELHSTKTVEQRVSLTSNLSPLRVPKKPLSYKVKPSMKES
jgi:hypothetical protein